MSETDSINIQMKYAVEESWVTESESQFNEGDNTWHFGTIEPYYDRGMDNYGDRIYQYFGREMTKEIFPGEDFYVFCPQEDGKEGDEEKETLGIEEDEGEGAGKARLSRQASRRFSKRESRILSRQASRALSRQGSRRLSRQGSRRLSRQGSRRLSRPSSRRLSRPPSKRGFRRDSRRPSRRPSRRGSRRPSRYPSSSSSREKRKEKRKVNLPTRKLFVHSSPVNFPDLALATKSTFGPTFLKSTGDVGEDVNLIRTLTESSFATLQSFLNSFDRILSAPFADQHKRHLTNLYKESMLRNLERHGITSTSEGGLHWNFYPTTQNYLYSIQIGDHIHQTRILGRIEDRILSGHVQRLRLPYAWPTESVWTGHWDLVGMAGSGTYAMPHGVTYQGKMLDGMFHDNNATLTYPNQFKAINCVYERGKLISCQFQFPDSLVYSSSNPDEWDYCRFPDRRFWSEVQNGLKPAKISQKTEVDPPRRIAPGCYDTNDGFYDPETLMLISPYGELLRVPTCEEAMWIQHYCRKGFFEPSDFRPDLFENWFNFDKEFIDLILSQHAKYRTGKITYTELQQFYADFDMLPTWSKYKKRRLSQDIQMENFIKSIPSPKSLGSKFVKKFKGHKLHADRSSIRSNPSESEKSPAPTKDSKSLMRFQEDLSQRLPTPGRVASKSSKISFRLMMDAQDSKESASYTRLMNVKRTIPEKFLEYLPVLDPPFEVKAPPASPDRASEERAMRTRCSSAATESSKRGDSVVVGEDPWDRMQVQRFAASLIWGIINDILLLERERHRKRLKWAQTVPLKVTDCSRLKPVINEKCLGILEELFYSIPEKEEFCDSDPTRACDLKKLAQDKYRVLQYWGTRIFNLKFEK